jgi:pimeloyl-ACP methyl ester carboxylesterase
MRMSIPQEIPFIVLSAATATDAELAERESWVAASKRGRHVRVKETGHWIQLEQPDVVVAAVRELLQ